MNSDLKTHFQSDLPKQLTACNLVDPYMPREAVRLTKQWRAVNCLNCKRTVEWFAAKQSDTVEWFATEQSDNEREKK